ncbi:hypothetical protein AK830_g5997 [Neonectria ditissima]|uniref:F-box domain-containing protein n=1 Tax=Neonectria ditissima TaxID=78410 RepID=A0A0P7B2D1_9HYPO|nr:hypothetical protein AK830_g5997 [Neonectria ditissima]
MDPPDAKAPTSRASLVHLPLEILQAIVPELPNCDLKSLRATCTHLSRVVELRFSRVFLSASPRDVDVFRAVSDHEQFRKTIVEIVYDDARFAHEMEYKDGSHEIGDDAALRHYERQEYRELDDPSASEIPAWYQRIYRYNSMTIDQYGRDDVKRLQHYEVIKRFKIRTNVAESYRLYQMLLREQDQVIDSNSDEEALQYGLERFSNLKRVTITPAAHGSPVRPLYETPMIRSLPRGFIYLLPRGWPVTEDHENTPEAEPWAGDEEAQWRGFHVVTRVVARFGRKHPAARLCEFVIDTNDLLTGIDCRIFEEGGSVVYNDLVDILSRPGFSRLDLALFINGQDETRWRTFRSGHLRRALQAAPSLESVRLATILGNDEDFNLWDMGDSDVQFIPLRNIFPVETWSHLRDFGLFRVIIKQGDLIDLLLALSPTLQTVELSFLVFLEQGSYEGLLEDMRSTLGWREQLPEKRPEVIIHAREENQLPGMHNRVSREAEDFLYGEGENPFHRCTIELGTGTTVDTFDPYYERPHESYTQLTVLGYRAKDDWWMKHHELPSPSFAHGHAARAVTSGVSTAEATLATSTASLSGQNDYTCGPDKTCYNDGCCGSDGCCGAARRTAATAASQTVMPRLYGTVACSSAVVAARAMEYLPHPTQTAPPVEVPYVAKHLSDDKDFASFPSRGGFDIGTLEDESVERIASLAQSWLYFGLIGFFFQEFQSPPVDFEKLKLEKVSADGSIELIVHSEELKSLLDSWYKSAVDPAFGIRHNEGQGSNRDPFSLSDLLTNKSRCLEHLKVSMQHAQRFEALSRSRSEPIPASVVDEREVSIMERDYQLTEFYDPHSLERCSPMSHQWEKPSPSATVLLAQLEKRGWCVFRARQMCSKYNYAIAYYLSKLPVKPDHISHEKCTESSCVAHNVDMKNYSTRHVTEDCECQMIHVPHDKLRSIIKSGGIPLVAVREREYGRLELDVESMSNSPRYVAFSHVWSDGLGNPKANALPHCQLKKLAGYTRNITLPASHLNGKFATLGSMKLDVSRMSSDLRTEWFWFDTLCIPVGTTDEDMALKFKAINQMAAIYSCAMQVLVLDSTVERMKVAEIDVCELFARVSLMAWMTRCWTFQEAALAGDCQIQTAEISFDPLRVPLESRLNGSYRAMQSKGKRKLVRNVLHVFRTVYLMFKEGAVRDDGKNASPMLQGRLTTRPVTAEEALQVMLARPLKVKLHLDFNMRQKSWFDNKDTDEAVNFDFLRCWNVLGQRTTTMANDIHIIVANILNINAFTILNMDNPQDRMAAILWSLDSIPLAIFFDNTSQRYKPDKFHNNRWLPLYPSQKKMKTVIGLCPSENLLLLDSDEYCEETEDEQRQDFPLALFAMPLTVRMPRILFTEGTTSLVLEIEFHRPADDEASFPSEEFCNTVLILESLNTDGNPITDMSELRGVLSGACFHQVQRQTFEVPSKITAQGLEGSEPTKGLHPDPPSKQAIEVVFDCPITAYVRGTLKDTSAMKLPVVNGAVISSPFIISVRAGNYPYPN